jgi:hypothetical protein
MGFWRKKAKEIILAAYRDAKKQGLRGRAVRRFITKNYAAYGHPRAKYPYRVWLEELDALMYKEMNGCSQLIFDLAY